MLTADQIAIATHCPLMNVRGQWPLLVAALEEFGLNSPLVQIAAAATMAVETAHRFLPIEEFGGPAYWAAHYENRADLGNTHPGDGVKFHGMGDIQITGEANFEAAGKALGLDLVNHPELALEPTNAARIFAWFFKVHRVAEAADRSDWRTVRVRVNGINHATGLPNGWADFNACVSALLKSSQTQIPSPSMR